MIKYFLIILGLFTVFIVAIFGYKGQRSTLTPIEIFPDMDRQAKVKAQKPSEFFADGKGDRLPVAGVVPMGYNIPEAPRQQDGEAPSGQVAWDSVDYGFSVGEDYISTGRVDEVWGDGIPIEVTEEFMARGRDRYMIYCSVCHGASGDGRGTVAQYQGMAGLVPTYHQDRLRVMPDGEIYNTVAYGKGQMYGYNHALNIADRWAVVAYLRVLQKSQNLQLAELPDDLRNQLPEPAPQEEAEPAADTEATPEAAAADETEATGEEEGESPEAATEESVETPTEIVE
ncbi:MAG: c-type cytochrome [Verrucomicrobiales bacterium]